MTVKIHGKRIVERMEKANRINEMQMVLRRTVMEIERLTVQAAQTKKEISKLEAELNTSLKEERVDGQGN